MLPAFLLAGAVAAFIPPATVLRYLGAQAKRSTAYSVAAVSGAVLPLCSCNVVPLFVSIYRRGAGVGPAFTFLLAGPAISIVSAIFVFQIIGAGPGIWRLIWTPVAAVIVGAVMSLLFRREEATRQGQIAMAAALAGEHATWRVWPLFGLLLAAVIYGGQEMPAAPKAIGMGALAGILAGFFAVKFTLDEFKDWMREFWRLVKMVIPILVPVLLLIAYISYKISIVWVSNWLNAPPGDTLGLVRATIFGDVFGSLMYFPILAEVAFVKAFLLSGMSIGPGMAILFTGPGLSLPGAIIVAREIGWTKVATYMTVVMVLTTALALLYVSEIGQYICACMTAGG